MSKQEYQYLLEYLDERFTKIDNRLDKVETRLDRHDVLFDSIFKKLLTIEQELTIFISRVNRLESTK